MHLDNVPFSGISTTKEMKRPLDYHYNFSEVYNAVSGIKIKL